MCQGKRIQLPGIFSHDKGNEMAHTWVGNLIKPTFTIVLYDFQVADYVLFLILVEKYRFILNDILELYIRKLSEHLFSYHGSF